MRFANELLVSGLIIAGICIIVNPVGVSAGDIPSDITLQYCGKTPTQSCREFTALLNWLIQTGKVRTDYNDRRASVLKLPAGAFAKARGAPGDSSQEKPDRMCSLLFDQNPSQPKARPVCIVINTLVLDTTTHKMKESYFRIGLDGRAEMAVDAEGKLDDRGEGLTGSAKYQSLNMKKPEIKAKLEHEVAFWLKRANDDAAAKPAADPTK